MNIMKLLKIALTALVLCSISALSLNCASESDSAVPENQIVTVQRGDLTIDITAVGNLALSHTEDLAFEIAGTVEEVLMEEGDAVLEGQVLAKLDMSEWQDELESLENQVTAEERDLLQTENNLEKAEQSLEQAKYNLNEAEDNLQFTEARYSIDMVSKAAVEMAEQRVVIAEQSVIIAETGLEIAEANLKAAEQSLEDAREELNEALETSPEITAPFDGFITMVNVEGGDEVLKGTVAVQLADPNKFEADVLVSEMDILQVKLGGSAWVQVDAVQGLSLSAEVTHISPTATIQAGVVNYKVKVKIQSLQAMPTMTPEGFQLREGLTVTVSIVVDERTDVLLIPNSAIIRQGQQTYVQVMSPDGITEERLIQTGISDWQYTEVTDGLSEGEKIVILQTTSISTTPTTPQQGGRMPFFPGGRLHQ